ncbi:MAG: KpsF/GutQ family sugar-phosphate isomerase [Chitinophagaceae bacterium]
MKPVVDIQQTALACIQTEYEAVLALQSYINDAFVQAVETIHRAQGRLVISGIGKSAIIAQKIVATLNSTGTPALFLHAADAIHGDLGMIRSDDIVMLISKSGETPEIKVLVPFIQQFGNTLIALCGAPQSYLATQSDYFINCSVAVEACPNNLAPTSSTTAQLVMGDALAVCLLALKGFKPADFARFHPGGALGKRLYLRVGDLSRSNAKPKVEPHTSSKQTLFTITENRLGAAVVCNEAGAIQGIVTDGDIRRMLEKHPQWEQLTAADIMSQHPKTIHENDLAVDALTIMRANNISQLVVENDGKFAGMIHLHDLIREGII